MAYSPAEYLGQLEAHLAGLQQQRQGLQQQLAAAAAGAYQQMSTALGATSTGVPLPADLPALAEELVVLQGVQQYLAYVQVGRGWLPSRGVPASGRNARDGTAWACS